MFLLHVIYFCVLIAKESFETSLATQESKVLLFISWLFFLINQHKNKSFITVFTIEDF